MTYAPSRITYNASRITHDVRRITHRTYIWHHVRHVTHRARHTTHYDASRMTHDIRIITHRITTHRASRMTYDALQKTHAARGWGATTSSCGAPCLMSIIPYQRERVCTPEDAPAGRGLPLSLRGVWASWLPSYERPERDPPDYTIA